MNGEGLIIDLGGEDFEVTRYNTHLYTFMGSIATRNHIFVITGEDDDCVSGVYVWEMFQPEAFNRLRSHLDQHKYPQYLNLNEISDLDEQSFEAAVKRQVGTIGDFVPEDL